MIRWSCLNVITIPNKLSDGNGKEVDLDLPKGKDSIDLFENIYFWMNKIWKIWG